MLTQLSLRDFAVVRSADLHFGPGMTVISGETGAGKSLLVDALLWLAGTRADPGMVRNGALRAELSAEFALDDAPEGAAWLVEHELDEGRDCQLRRVVRADGGSKAWINGRVATLAQLGQLAALLVEIHGQNEHQTLLLRERQRQLLDGFGQYPEQLAAVHALARRWQALRAECTELEARGDSSELLADLEHQLDELQGEDLAQDSLERLQVQHRRSSQTEALLSAYTQLTGLLGDEEGNGAGEPLRRARGVLGRWIDAEPLLADAAQLVESAQLQIAEAAALIERARDELELDPQEQARLEQRLSRLHDLARKHRVPLARLAEHRQRLLAEREVLRGSADRLNELRQELQRLEADWRVAAEVLSQARGQATLALSAAVSALLPALGMAGGRFEIQLEALADPRPHPQGLERVEFLVSANPGQPLRPLRKVASGGELARLALALEVATPGIDPTPSMVFDEVDAGIGGAVAEAVGQQLRRLARSRQVLCVTHLPQVAAQGHRHYRVNKTSDGQDTWSETEALDEAGRIEEVARMLGGAEITAAVRTSARQLLDKARRGDPDPAPQAPGVAPQPRFLRT